MVFSGGSATIGIPSSFFTNLGGSPPFNFFPCEEIIHAKASNSGGREEEEGGRELPSLVAMSLDSRCETDKP